MYFQGKLALGFLATSFTFLSSFASASRFSYELKGYENTCFHFHAPETNKKASFYFAIYRGDDFEVDFTVKGPNDYLVLEGKNQRQGDYVFTANYIGEYSFCFTNPSGSNKVLDLDIYLDGDQDNHSPLKFKDPEHLTNMEKALSFIQRHSSQLMRDQRFFRTRENRNENILSEISSQIHYYAFFIVGIIGFMSLIQVLAIRSFFSSKSRY
ncbi:hypothetical protein DSO57_1017954 [Entomophthora muscae]|uniref:Uncharacterized protein n=1 Tax=Entomophthora muscae TaxID=34485 RepID=A0ACC2SHT0_9FUNG|nr:hypothetical protein DSO57_1017954 [Entomophthora muscae]